MDKNDFEQQYLALLPGLYRLAKSILYSHADAEDAVQSAALKALKAMNRLRPGNEKAYIVRIVINECHNIQRRRKRELPVDTFPEEEGTGGGEAAELRIALNALNEKYRTALLLRYMEGYSEKETAQILELSLPALKSRLHRARKALANELGQEVDFE